MQRTIFVGLIVVALTVAGFSTQGQSTSEIQGGQTNVSVIGYAWAMNPTSVPQNLTAPFKPLKHGGVYQSLGKTADGLLIVCQLTSGQEALALMSFKDTMGYPIVIRQHENNQVALFHPILDRLDTGKLKPADVPLEVGHRYEVVGRRDDMLTLIFVAGAFRQPVETVATNVKFLSVSDYQKKKTAMFDGLRHAADQRMRELSVDKTASFVTEVFLKYSDQLADETVDERAQLANEYAKTFEKKREEYDARQKAMGLVNYAGVWMTPDEASAKYTAHDDAVRADDAAARWAAVSQQERGQNQTAAPPNQRSYAPAYNSNDNNPQDTARSTTSGNDTFYYDSKGYMTGKSTTSRYGDAFYYDSKGHMTGKSTTSRYGDTFYSPTPGN